MEFSRGSHCVYYVRYHLVFVTKYRRKALKLGMGAYLLKTFEAVSRRYPELVIYESNTDEDHVHLLVSVPPAMSLAHAVNLLKTNSAQAMRKKFPFLEVIKETSW